MDGNEIFQKLYEFIMMIVNAIMSIVNTARSPIGSEKPSDKVAGE